MTSADNATWSRAPDPAATLGKDAAITRSWPESPYDGPVTFSPRPTSTPTGSSPAGSSPTRVGILALQGDVREHARAMEAGGAVASAVRRPDELAAVDALIGLEGIGQVAKVTGFVSSAPGFHGQPAVVDGASTLLGRVFGAAGVHARSAVGVSVLPLNSPVEVELIVEFD